MAVPSERITLPARGWQIDPVKTTALGLACWVAAGAVAGLVMTGRADAVDAIGLMFWRASPAFAPVGPPWLLEMVRDLTSLGGVLLRNLLALGAVVALLFLRLRREAVLFALTVALGWLVNTALKAAFGRERPEIVPHLTEAGGASFPSGHSFNSAVVFIGIALAFATLSARHSVRATVIGAALVFSLAVAWTRVWLGVHFPTDVLAGWLAGAGWAFVAAALLHKPAHATADLTGRSGT